MPIWLYNLTGMGGFLCLVGGIIFDSRGLMIIGGIALMINALKAPRE